MDNELEQKRIEREKKLSEHDRYLAQLARASDAELGAYIDEEIAVHEGMKARAQAPAREASEYDHMTSAEFNDAVANIPDDGRARIAGRGIELTLDEAMSAERRRRADGGE